MPPPRSTPPGSSLALGNRSFPRGAGQKRARRLPRRFAPPDRFTQCITIEQELTRKMTHHPPNPSVHSTEPRFAGLSHDSQVALAAWAVLLKSDPPTVGDRLTLPPTRYGRAVGDIAVTVGLRSRKRMNYDPLQRKRQRRVRRPATAEA